MSDKQPVDPQTAHAIADAQTAQTKAVAPASNTVSDETGQFDTRFMLWRAFCAKHNVPVETLPSELSGAAREAWDTMKDLGLHKPAEGK